MHIIYESCISQYKVKRRKILEGGEMTRNDSVDRFMCGLIGGVEDLVHFKSNNNSMFISLDKLAIYPLLAVIKLWAIDVVPTQCVGVLI